MTKRILALSGIALSAALFSSVAGPGLAAASPFQQGPPPEGGGGQWNGGEGRRAPDPDQQVKRLTKRLNLSSDQQSQIKTILTDRSTQMKSIREDSSLQPEDRRSKMQALRTDTDTKIQAVLNDKQKAEYQKMQSEMRDRMQNRRGEGGGAPPQP